MEDSSLQFELRWGYLPSGSRPRLHVAGTDSVLMLSTERTEFGVPEPRDEQCRSARHGNPMHWRRHAVSYCSVRDRGRREGYEPHSLEIWTTAMLRDEYEELQEKESQK